MQDPDPEGYMYRNDDNDIEDASSQFWRVIHAGEATTAAAMTTGFGPPRLELKDLYSNSGSDMDEDEHQAQVQFFHQDATNIMPTPARVPTHVAVPVQERIIQWIARRVGICLVVLILTGGLVANFVLVTLMCAFQTSWATSTLNLSPSASATHISPLGLEVLTLQFHVNAAATTNKSSSSSSSSFPPSSRSMRTLVPNLNASAAAMQFDGLSSQITALFGPYQQRHLFSSTLTTVSSFRERTGLQHAGYGLPHPENLALASTAFRNLAHLELAVRTWTRAVAQHRTTSTAGLVSVIQKNMDKRRASKDTTRNSGEQVGTMGDYVTSACSCASSIGLSPLSSLASLPWCWWRYKCACSLVPLYRLHEVASTVQSASEQTFGHDVLRKVAGALDEVWAAVDKSCAPVDHLSGFVTRDNNNVRHRGNRRSASSQSPRWTQQQQQEGQAETDDEHEGGQEEDGVEEEETRRLDAWYRRGYDQDEAHKRHSLRHNAHSGTSGADAGAAHLVDVARPMSQALSQHRDAFSRARVTCRDIRRSLDVVERLSGCVLGEEQDSVDLDGVASGTETGTGECVNFEFPPYSLVRTAQREVETMRAVARKTREMLTMGEKLTGWWGALWARTLVISVGHAWNMLRNWSWTSLLFCFL